jgi:hypothetical protein
MSNNAYLPQAVPDTQLPNSLHSKIYLGALVVFIALVNFALPTAFPEVVFAELTRIFLSLAGAAGGLAVGILLIRKAREENSRAAVAITGLVISSVYLLFAVGVALFIGALYLAVSNQ